MKRIHFIQTLAATMALPAYARIHSNRENKGFVVKSGEARHHERIFLKNINAGSIDIKVSGADTDGLIAIYEQPGTAPGNGTPLHVHYNQDEIFQVMDGEFGFQVGTDKYILQKGDSIFLPRRVPHSWVQRSQTAKMSIIVQPAGKLENFCNHHYPIFQPMLCHN